MLPHNTEYILAANRVPEWRTERVPENAMPSGLPLDAWVAQLTGADVRAMVQAARAHGRAVQVILKADAQGRVTHKPKIISD